MIQKVLNILNLVGFFLLVADLEAQDTIRLEKAAERKFLINKKGMKCLTAWASINMASGSLYFVSQSTTDKYFYAMNAGWGAVNLAIALPGLLSKHKPINSYQKLNSDPGKTAKIFAINAGLDVVYIGAGIALQEYSKSVADDNTKQMFQGFGNSVVVQGSALLAFDGIMWYLNRNLIKRLKHDKGNLQVFATPSSIQLNYRF